MLNYKQAAEYTGFSIDYLRYLKKRGKIPFIQPTGKNGKVFFETVDLDEWKAKKKLTNHSEL